MVLYLHLVLSGDPVFLDECENTLGRNPDCNLKMEYDFTTHTLAILVENWRMSWRSWYKMRYAMVESSKLFRGPCW